MVSEWDSNGSISSETIDLGYGVGWSKYRGSQYEFESKVAKSTQLEVKKCVSVKKNLARLAQNRNMIACQLQNVKIVRNDPINGGIRLHFDPHSFFS